MTQWKKRQLTLFFLCALFTSVQAAGKKDLDIELNDGTIYECENMDFGITVEKLKDLIQKSIGVPLPLQKLFFNGQMLQDNQMLSEAWIAKGSRVNLQFESMKIFVQKQDDNSVINLDVNYIDKITKVKQNICTKTGILISQQHYISCGTTVLHYIS